MGMGMVLVTADMLKNDNGRQTGETTGTNYNDAISALKQVIPNLSKISDQKKKIPTFHCNKKEKDFKSSIFSTSKRFTAKSSTVEEFPFDKTNCCVRCTSA
eukprot:8594040-Ditylum_brightwellii.AAC.1